MIDKLAWILIKDKKFYFVRTKGSVLFYNVGGKREGEETDHETLIK